MFNNEDSWKILIVDDDEEVHSITRMVLDGFFFDDKGIRLMSAYSGREAIKVVRDNPDIALVLLDVVMETDDAGLRVVDKIRDEFKNHIIQIVLRTGQAGQVCEGEVIKKYEINAYASKVSLTARNLIEIVTSSLMAFSQYSLARADE